jgi:uncharacterized protein (TIGR03067 family)
MLRAYCVVASCLITGLTAAGKDSEIMAAIEKEIGILAGTWTVVKMEANGRSFIQKDSKLPAPKLVVKDGNATFVTPDGNSPKGKIAKAIDPTSKLKKLTFPLEGNITFFGIYKIEGDKLSVCGEAVDLKQEKNPEDQRPNDFDSNKGMLIVLERDKK